MADKTPPQVKMDERKHVEEPFLHQLETMTGLSFVTLYKLQSLKTGLMQHLLSGRVRVKNLNYDFCD